METFTTDAMAMLQYLPGSGGGAFGAPVDLVEGGGSFPRPVDIDGDGDLDVISAEFFLDSSSYAWFEQGSGFSWTRHIIDAESGPAIQIQAVADLDGDGVWRAVGSNHTNTATFPPDDYESAVVALTPGADPGEPWEKVQLSSGIVSDPGSFLAPMAAPGIFDVGDLDYDGDEDIALSGDGDPTVYWMEQTTPGTFVMHVLHDDLPQAGGMKIADLDGDGCNEIVVTGYLDGDIYVYQRADL